MDWIGSDLPLPFLISFLRVYGLDLAEMLNQLFANAISTFFAVDLILASIVFVLFSYRDSRRCDMGYWWVYLLATLLVGLSFSLPLFLSQREQKIHPNQT